MDGWNTTFLLGRPIFKGYVSFREGTCPFPKVGFGMVRLEVTLHLSLRDFWVYFTSHSVSVLSSCIDTLPRDLRGTFASAGEIVSSGKEVLRGGVKATRCFKLQTNARLYSFSRIWILLFDMFHNFSLPSKRVESVTTTHWVFWLYFQMGVVYINQEVAETRPQRDRRWMTKLAVDHWSKVSLFDLQDGSLKLDNTFSHFYTNPFHNHGIKWKMALL